MLSALVLLLATGVQRSGERPPLPPKPPQVEHGLNYPGQGEHQLNYHPGDPLQPISDLEGWFEPVQSVYQDDEYFLKKPGNMFHRNSPNYWHAELAMVTGKSTVITGILADMHDKVVFKGKTNGAEWAEVKLKLWLLQRGARRIVYVSSHPVGTMRVAGSRAAPTAFDVEISAATGLPEAGSSFPAFKIDQGDFTLKAELVTTDDKSTGVEVYVDGESVPTVPPSVYILPAVLTGGQGGTLQATAVTLAAAFAPNAAAAAPVKDGGFPVFPEPLQDFSRSYNTTMQQWALKHETDVDFNPAGVNDFVTNAIGAKLANFEDVLGRLGGNAKVIGLLTAGDYNKTNRNSGKAAAFTLSQKAILVQEPYARWTVALHEVNHASAFTWSEDQMIAEYGFAWHGASPTIASGIKILGGTRQRLLNAETIMGQVHPSDDSDSRWIAFGTYHHLLAYYQSGGDPPVIDIHGHLLMGQTREACVLEPGYTLSGVPDPLPQTPNKGYSITLHDRRGRILQTCGFVPGYDLADAKTNVSTFTVRLALPPLATGFSVVGPGGVLATRNLSSAPPTLRVTSGTPVLTPTNRTVHIAWTGTSPDGLPLQYTVLYTEDRINWAPAAVEQDGTDLSFAWGIRPVISRRMAFKPLIRVFATDGARSSSVDVPVSGM